jgi:hypothetical protein
MATVSGSLSPNLVMIHRHQFRPVVWKKSRPVPRTRSFKYVVLLLLFTACLSGISGTAAAAYALLTYLR